jgi:uncharacterized membrane protein YbaN (DUF454 family)
MRLAWTVAGIVALGLGAIGALLPLLPTTPFVILAAFAFGRGAPALRARLDAHATFGPAIRDWSARGAIAARHKAAACAAMSLALVVSWAASVPTAVLGVQTVVMAAAATFVLTRPA